MKSFSELTSASYVSNSDILAISQENSGTYSSKKTTVKEVSDFANQNFAEEYDSTSSYAVGDYCIYESVLYKCTASTTGSFDNTKWTSVVVTDEMGSGGGGTGGHTIIDENGNSMTARAGLQFVGGANVSDDPTNNKTIVDLASAGGIDGVFIDTNNVIQAWTTFTTETTYTATEDCIVVGGISTTTGKTATISVDGSVVYSHYSQNGEQSIEVPIRLKKGQTILLHNETDWANINGYVVYGIQTGTTHSKFQPVIYSTEEREIGVWTDGKPLYQKTFILNPTQATETIDISSLHIDKMVSRNTTCTRDTGGSGIQQKDVQYRSESVGSDTYGLICEIRGTDLYFDISGYNYSQITEIRATLQYTKTTDVAGSGSWTPQGVPTHHYSTDEQVIGTWIDGSTLYEKTIHINNGGNLNTGDNQFAHNISNFGRIINAKGNVIRGTGSLAKSMVIPYASAENNSGWDIGIYEFNSTVGYVKVGSSYVGDYILNDCYVTLQYTKSS